MNHIKNYEMILKQAELLIEDCEQISALANVSALLKQNIPNISWVGFYIVKNDTLILGPFQGKVACTKIPIGKGVCGTAVKERKNQLVPNVHKIQNHIACDCDSNSELVINIYNNNEIVAVLDLDSYLIERFDELDLKMLEKLSNILSKIF